MLRKRGNLTPALSKGEGVIIFKSPLLWRGFRRG